MSANSAPGVDWIAIRDAVVLGQRSLREIAKEHGITHQAIMARRDREGWITGNVTATVTTTAALENSRTTQTALAHRLINAQPNSQ